MTSTGAHQRTVLVCDDNQHLRAALRAMIDGLPRFRHVGDAVDGSTCLDLLARTRPEVLILDVSMPGGGADLVHAARAASPAMRIVMHSGRADESTRQAMLNAGADAYVVKSGRLSLLVRALDGAAHGADGVGVGDHGHAHKAHLLRDDEAWAAELVRYSRKALVDHGQPVMTTGDLAAVRRAHSQTVGLRPA